MAPRTSSDRSSKESSSPGRGQSGAETAERILDAAESVFAEKGYSGTTLRDVATQVGIQIPSLYNHFSSKEALYQAVLGRGVAPLMAALSEAVEAGPIEDSGDPHKIVEQTMDVLSARPMLPRLIFHETLAGGQHLSGILAEVMEPVFDRSERLLENSAAGRRWEPEERRLLVLALFHIVVGYFTTAPLYRDLTSIDLMTDEALTRQTRFLNKMVRLLMEEEPGLETPGAGH